MKTNNKVIMVIEGILAATAAIVMCISEIYVDQHPIKAFINGFSTSDMIPIVIGGFIAATIATIVITKTIAGIKLAVDKKKAKKAAK